MNAKRTPKQVGLYVRTSTANGQTTRNQERELKEAAKRHGWHIAAVYRDQGISGAKGRDERPGFDRLLQAVARREIDMIAAWSVDRLGRSLTDLVAVLQELHAKGVDLYLHQQGLDTSTPSGRAMFQMLGVFAEFERAIIRERVMAGLTRGRKPKGRAWDVRQPSRMTLPRSARSAPPALPARRCARSPRNTTSALALSDG